MTFSQGTVTVTDGGNPAVPAQMNLPLPAGVQITTGDDGQAEIEFEDGSVARLTPNSALALDTLDIAPGDSFVTHLNLVRGLAYFELRATPEYTYSISAGGDVVSPVENTTVRVDFDTVPASFAVLDGSATVQRANSFQAQLQAGETLRADASNSSRYFLSQQIAADSWDQWNADMDQQAAQQASASTDVRNSYAGAQGYGWSDLDADGTWYNVPGQGPVWQPFAAEDDAEFDPYGDGAWVWYPATGYIWTSAYPWGWTPYRCGVWSFYASFGWGWAPGTGCGGFGWGFVGAGYVVNIGVGPRGYRPVHVPVAKPGPVRPVLPVRLAGDAGRRVDHRMAAGERRPRQIGGVTAQPIAPVHLGLAAGRQNALGRDFPIDRTTHGPALGTATSRPTNVYRARPLQPQEGPPAQAAFPRGGTTGGAPQNGLPQTIYGSGSARSGQDRVQQPQPGTQQTPMLRGQQKESDDGRRARGLQQSNSLQDTAQPSPQRNTPQPQTQGQQRQFTPPVQAQPQHTAPERPMYSAPVQQPQRQNFSPPAGSAPAPRYSTPPAAAAAPHYSSPPPPPPPPPPAPHVSAPPPATQNTAPTHR